MCFDTRAETLTERSLTLCYYRRIPKSIWMTILLVVLFSLLPIRCTMAQDSTSLFLSGIKLNNNRPYGMIGWIKNLSPRVLLYTVADVGGNNAAFSELVHVRIYRFSKLSILLNIGSNLELITNDPDFTDHDSYLSAASGITLRYRFAPTGGIHFGVMWLTPAHPPLPIKLFLGVTFPMQE